MKKQFKISLNKDKEVLLDLNKNEVVSIQFDNNPFAEEKNMPTRTIRISGNRWVDEEFYSLEWAELPVNFGDTFSVSLIESEAQGTMPSKEERYVKPEEECSFCQKKKSEVKLLIAAKFMSHICNECVLTCMELLEKENAI